MTYEAPLFVPGLETLARCEFDVLMQAVINKYNENIIDFNHACDGFEELEKEYRRQTQEIESYQRLCDSHRQEIDDLKSVNTNQTTQLHSYESTLQAAEQIAIKSMALKKENESLKIQVKQLQQTLTAANPERLKKQNLRLKERNVELNKKSDRLQTEVNNLIKVVKNRDKELLESANTHRDLLKQLAHNNGAGVYHKGDDHLIVWPQKLTMERSDGSTFNSRALLYLHQSGRGGLMAFDPVDGTHLCASPKNGLRPKDSTVEWAHNWLYKVNELQEGVVQDEDMQAVNYNPDNTVQI